VDDLSGEGLRGVDFVVDLSDPERPITGFIDRFVGSTPLDTLRERERRGGFPWTIEYRSTAPDAWETEKDAAHRDPQPGGDASPSSRP
jgi:hypothetical protein